MATTQHPLVWDFYRKSGNVGALGGVSHYLDEAGQSLYLNDSGLATRVAAVPEGHWETSEWLEEIQITDYDDFSHLRLDHPSNGVLYGIAANGREITFLRYIYGMDVSDIVDSWSWLTQNDSPIAQFDSALQNIDPEIFGEDTSLFQPGARIKVHIFMGDSDAYPIGTVWLDESDYDQAATTIKMSGRNTIGYYLKDQTFDDNTKFSGTTTEVLTDILLLAGLNNFIIQPLETEKEFEFKPSDTFLSGIETILDYYTTVDEKMEIVELTNGTICIGFDYWVSKHLPRNRYSFDEGREVFKRKTTRAADGTFTKVRATGKDSDGNELKPVSVPIENFPYWSLGKQRTKHLSAPDGMSQEGLQRWAEAQAKVLQYIGIAEDFVGPFRPQLVVGDIAEVVRGDIGTSLGIITQIKQVFDKTSGYMTEFSVDSGGVATDGDSYTVYSRSAKANGYNRKQSIIDLVKYTAEKIGKVDSLTSSDIGAESKGTSDSKVSLHNDNPQAHPYILGKVASKVPMPEKSAVGQYLKVLSVDSDGKVLSTEAVSATYSAPVYDLFTLGLASLPTSGSVITLNTNMTAIRSALDSGPVKILFQITIGNATDVSAIISPVYLPTSNVYQAVFLAAYGSDLVRCKFEFTDSAVKASCTLIE